MIQTYPVLPGGTIWVEYDQSFFPPNEAKVSGLAISQKRFYGILGDSNELVSVKMKNNGPERGAGSDIISWEKIPISPEGMRFSSAASLEI
jgi:hypothetical protein